MTTTAWLVAIGALMGIVAAIGLLHIRASAELAAAKKRVKSLSLQNQTARTYHAPRKTAVAQQRRRRPVSNDDEY
jgi:hypothetical protein